MKKYKIFNEPLLLTQLEIAMLLGITRTQWAMYTMGQRGLPAHSKANFQKLLQNANERLLTKREKSGQIEAQEIEVQKELDTLLQINTLKLLQIQRKLTRMETQFEAALNTLHFLHTYQNDTVSKSLIQVLEINAHKALDKNRLALQEVVKIKLEVLKHEKNLSEQRIKSNDNAGFLK